MTRLHPITRYARVRGRVGSAHGGGLEGCNRNSFPKQRSCLRCIPYRLGCCKRQLCGEDAGCSSKRRLLVKLMSKAEARNVVVPQFDVALTQHDRMRGMDVGHKRRRHLTRSPGYRGTPSDLIRD